MNLKIFSDTDRSELEIDFNIWCLKLKNEQGEITGTSEVVTHHSYIDTIGIENLYTYYTIFVIYECHEMID